MENLAMLTTVELEKDVLAELQEVAAREQKSISQAANDMLRKGLRHEPFRVKPYPMGLREGFSYDSISTLLAMAEGEDHR
jgi:hypothetical protein